jgi:hypothetical protein
MVVGMLLSLSFLGLVAGEASALEIWAGRCSDYNGTQGCTANYTIFAITVLGSTGGGVTYCMTPPCA